MYSNPRARIGFSSILFAILMLGALASTMAIENFPLEFQGAKNPAETEKLWGDLAAYKMWATGSESMTVGSYGPFRGIFMRENDSIPDTLGRIGSGKGGLSFYNINHTLGGPLIFAGPLKVDNGGDVILSGPSHFTSIEYGNEGNWNNNKINGKFCTDDGKPARTFATSNCDGVPDADKDLDLPVVSGSAVYDSVIQGLLLKGRVEYIDIPPGKAPYNLHITGNIEFENESSLFIRMPYGGRSTRIIVDGFMKLSSTARVQVVYADPGDTFDGKWHKTYTTDINEAIDEYQGHLLFYLRDGLNNEAFQDHAEGGGTVVEGTYVIPGNLIIKDHMNFAGQFLAKNIYVDADFRSRFRYVPFEGAQVQTDAFGSLEEGHDKDEIHFTLTKEASVDIAFKYCFEFGKGDFNGYKPAEGNDIVDGADNFPVCGKDKPKEVHFVKGEVEKKGIQFLTAKDDEVEEGDEYFYIHIMDLEGATFEDPTKSNLYPVYIIDRAKIFPPPESKNDTIHSNKAKSIGMEDIPFAVNEFEVIRKVEGEEPKALENYKVKIVALPDSGSLKFDGEDVKVDDEIASSDLNKLIFQGDSNAFGDSAKGFVYTSFKFKVIDAENGKISEDDYSMSIEVSPVNDTVKVTKTELDVADTSSIGSVVGRVAAQDSVDTKRDDKNKLTFEFIPAKDLKKNEMDISEAFDIVSKTGDIKVKEALDVYKNIKYRGLVVVTDFGVPGDRDPANFLKDTAEISVTITGDTIPHPKDSVIIDSIIKVDGGKADSIGYEDVEFSITSFPAYKHVTKTVKKVEGESAEVEEYEYKDPLTTYSVVITNSYKGQLTYNGKAVTKDDVIPSSDLKKGLLKYKSQLNEYGKVADDLVYDKLEFKIYNDKGNVSETKTMSIKMHPVNDEPVASDVDTSVVDSIPVGTVVGHVDAQDIADSQFDKEDKLTYKFEKANDLKEGETDVSEAFEIDPKNGDILVKVALDHDKDSVYRGLVAVTDNGVPAKHEEKDFLTKIVNVTINVTLGDTIPHSKDSVVVDSIIKVDGDKADSIGYEDVEFSITSFPAYKHVTKTVKQIGDSAKVEEYEYKDPLTTYSVVITNSYKGQLTYKGKKVTKDVVIPSADLKKGLLKYKSQQDEYGEAADGLVYDKLEFKIINDKGNASEPKTMLIKMHPVNDKPEVTKAELEVVDNSAKGTEVGHVAAQDIADSQFDTEDKLTFTFAKAKDLKENEKDISEAFEIDPVSGAIKVKDTLDYYKDSLYRGLVVVTDYGVPGERTEKDFLKDFAEVSIKLVLGDSIPGSKDTTIVDSLINVDGGKVDSIGYEDVEFLITAFPAFQHTHIDIDYSSDKGESQNIHKDKGERLTTYSVVITNNYKGQLTYNGKKVTKDVVIPSSDLKKGLLKYKSNQDEFGYNSEDFMYDTLEFKVINELGKASVVSRMFIVMKPTNDKPEVTKTELEVVDNSAKGSVVGHVEAQDIVDSQFDKEDKLTFTFAKAENMKENEKDISEAFEIDPVSGAIKVKDTLDYYKDSLYHGKVVVTDNGVVVNRKDTMSDEADVYVKLVLGDSIPGSSDTTIVDSLINVAGGKVDSIGYEDVEFLITAFPAFQHTHIDIDYSSDKGESQNIHKDKGERLTTYSVVITNNYKGQLTYNGKAVTDKDVIPSSDLKKGLLKYKSKQDEFGYNSEDFMYDTLEFKIINELGKASVVSRMFIVMKPTNDEPTFIHLNTFAFNDKDGGKIVSGALPVADSASVNSVVAYVKAQDTVDSDHDALDTLKYSLVETTLEANEKNAVDFFYVDELTGEIKVKEAFACDKDCIYHGKLVVTDNGVSIDRENKKSASIDFIVALNNIPLPPDSKDTTIGDSIIIVEGGKPDSIGYEDVEFSINAFPAFKHIDVNTKHTSDKGESTTDHRNYGEYLTSYKVVIVGKYKGQLTYNGKAVTDKDTIPSADLKNGLLKYKSQQDEFGYNSDEFIYDTVEFKIVSDDNLASEKKTMYIVMKPVNDEPEVTKTEISVADTASKGAVVGKVEAQDIVDSKYDKDDKLTYKFVAVKDLKDGEKDFSEAFEIDSKTGAIKVKAELDYDKDVVFHGKVVVTDNGVVVNRKDTMSDEADVYVKLVHGNRPPKITDAVFHIAENSPANTLVGKIVGHDVEDPDSVLVFGLIGSSNEFDVAKNGKITVKKGAVLDYEVKNEYSLKVNVKDSDGLTAEGTVKIFIDNTREPPTLTDTSFHVPENVPNGSTVGTVIPNNPEKDTLKFKIVTVTDKFKIREDGTIVTTGLIDYENEKVHKLKVVVTGNDGSTDTATVVINVDNIVEKPVVKITRADDGDTLWLNPDTIYTNKPKIDFEWTVNGKLRPDSLVEYPKNGTFPFIVCETDPSMDLPGCDTAIVKIDNSIPKVRLSKPAEDTSAISGVTIVEQVDESDSNFYVNHNDNTVIVGITDKGMGVDSTFNMNLRLDSLTNSKTSLEKIKKISKTEITLDDAEKAQTKSNMVNEEMVDVSFKKMVGDDSVTVDYITDKNGDIVKNSDGNAVMKVTYDTEINGEPAKVSYNVDAETGKIIKNENGGLYEYSYSYTDKFNGVVGVHYSLDEQGKFAKTEAGDLGYQVTYTYKNRFGNTATKNINVVVDKIVPEVKIITPENKLIVHSSGVDIKWTVDGEVQDTLVVQGLRKGLNKVVRTYRDKAGNEGSDTIDVYMKSPKEVDVNVEKPVTIVNEDSVRKYYDDNPPEKGQAFAVSMYDPHADKEVETIIGGTFGKKKGEKKEVYPGKEGHLGPTLLIDALAPRCGDKAAGGLCTLDDIVERDGKVSLEIGGGWDRKKVSVDEYVEKYCSDDFRKEYNNDPTRANLYKTRLHVNVWIYTNIGGFVDEYSFTQDVDNPDYVNEVGDVEMAFELKPDLEGNVITSKGRQIGTGAYIFNTEVKSVSELRCKLPNEEMGRKHVATDNLRKAFGYKRPAQKKK